MPKSLQIANISGIPVFIHWSFGLILAWTVYESYANGGGWKEALIFTLFILCIFFCVTLHEFGHAFAARRYGVGTENITLYPIGGVARLRNIPTRPLHEFVVAIAGPMVNVVIALVIFILLFLFPVDLPPVIGDSNFIDALMWANIVLVVFNLIPAFPMDGGRMFRALLSSFMNRKKATQIAVFVAWFLALGAAIWAITQGAYTLLLICVFVIFASNMEYKFVRFTAKLAEHSVTKLLRTLFTSFSSSERISEAHWTSSQAYEPSFLILEEDKAIATISKEQLEELSQGIHKEEPLSNHLQKLESFLSVEDGLDQALQIFQGDPELLLIPVMENETLVGVLDKQALNGFMEQMVKKK